MPSIFSFAQHYVLPFLVVISVVVFVHEFGHYWVARRCGIRVLSFSIGFGRPIFGWTDKHGTKWQVAWLPLGGYVKMFGDADPASSPDPAVKQMTAAEKKVSFFHQSVNKRMAVVVAGPVTNYLFAIVVLALLFIFQGQPYAPAIIGSVQENSAAAHAGLVAGDKVLSIDGSNVNSFDDLRHIVVLSTGAPLPFVIERNGAQQTLMVTPEISTQTDRLGGTHMEGKIGVVSQKMDFKKRPVLKAIGAAAWQTWSLTADSLKAIGQIILGSRPADEIGGPLRIAQMSGHIAQDGIWALVWFMGVISVNLGMINLFPVPLLDGGHLLFYVCEKIRGRPLGEKIQEMGFRVGLALVGSLMLFATWNDLVHLEVISRIKSMFS